jgi:transcriptional regulator with XRE-family HTH domain
MSRKPKHWTQATDAEFHEAVGKMLTAARGGIPQKDLCQAAGLSQSKTSRVEHGAPVTLLEYCRWCHFTDLDPVDFLNEVLEYVPGRAEENRQDQEMRQKVEKARRVKP